MEYLEEAIKAIQTDNAGIHKALEQTNDRVDELSEEVSKMSNGLHKIEGCMGPLCKNVESITDAIVKNGINAGDKSAVLTEVLKTIKILIVISAVTAILGMFGFYKMDTNAKYKDSEIKLRQSDSK
jgi:polyhydroxyalkanoate synthesis regulator phasin